MDELRCEKCHLDTALAELRQSVEEDRENVLARLSSLRSLSCTGGSGCEGEGEGMEELEGCLLDLEREREAWRGEQQRLSEQLEAAGAELAACREQLGERAVVTSDYSCQTDPTGSPLTSSVHVQTTQAVHRKQYPPLRHALTQTPPLSPHTPAKPSKQSSELRSLQKRVSSLERQAELLADARSEARRALAEEQHRCAHLQRQAEEVAYSLKVSSAENSSLSAEALVLRQANATLEETLQAGLLERDSESSAVFSRLEARLRASSDECTRQAATLHRLSKEISEKRAEIETLTESGARREREYRQNLTNKRHLVDEMKEQLQALKCAKQSNEDLLRKQGAEVRRVSESSAHLSSRNAHLKQQLSRVSEERACSQQELDRARQALSAHSQQLSLSQADCGRKEQLLRAAKLQVDQLSQLFGEEEKGRSEDLERRVTCLQVSMQEYRQTILCVSELIWRKRSGGVTRDILSLSTKEIMEVAKQGPGPVQPSWGDTSHYTHVVAALEKQPPFARPLAEFILSILDL